MFKDITPHELATCLEDSTQKKPILLDVREEWEFNTSHLDGSIHIPLGMLLSEGKQAIDATFDAMDSHYNDITSKPIICICRRGVRSQNAAIFLASIGFSNLYNLVGGMAQWKNDIDPSMNVA